ncbi:von Willebrand factor A domain-containing protein 5A isoform X1 [Piliocolobus tephrosceles]|uniref:von Willebrand factor A domain-containing protein 5A isoform X1 n=1 Tax=Piliocolobus tephrosceles TaxID=591936 RepID=UPI000C2A4C8E|nr:von Willebrand factor A domain-containing protein 5A isoform X1 [Piliocolobus tephrosceles]XP_023064287.1 von Willebrand factor A domain-containing protein 5A isoform X1 [Piliocolobus tephrosceles]XP_023064288.1 von Willebrand factor A domain-containing protein 5A isoform X1 [Piliocolobus tephrosceles]XP_023064289.1 von Willebrand factor A domain-containing protein 5A isoform X1 [Piliocolobus tephrosceles]XP_023064291.1 von Willebrand factor A domain-containing protein 5A isoform X1 [Pilioco
MVHFYGLLTLQREPVPLKSISVSVSIYEFVADVSATLNYENEEKFPLEAVFLFPMDEDSAVYSFEALVDGKKIVAELQDKMKARTNYEKAISQGHQAFLLEEDSSSRDVFSCNVGNLQPGSKAAVTLKYVQELPLETDRALRFVLPAVLNPRYQFCGLSKDSCLNVKTPIVPVEDLPYTLSMVTTIDSKHGIEKVQSNCPLSPTEYLGEDKTSAQVSLAAGHKFDRDVELLIYYSEVHTPSVVLEMGMLKMKPGRLMRDPSAMVSFYPNIPEDQPSNTCGEFVFLMDRSGSMQSPMSSQDTSQLRIQAAKETLILLLKSLPMGCYFNIYGFGSSYEAYFPKSVKYTQQTMEEALGRVKLMQADLGGTEILAPLQNIYREPSIPGHPLQLFVFTDGEVTDTFSVIKEVRINRQKHRCFSFGIGEGASTSLIKGIARASGGTSEFITGKDRMQSKALRTLKRSLQPVVEDVSLSWHLPPGLSAKMLSPEQTVIFRGQRLIIYAQLTGRMPAAETTAKVCLKYTLQGKTFEDKVTFPVQPKPDVNFTIHRLAAKSLLQTKDMGLRDTPASDKKDALNLSLESGIISSFTAFIAINKELNKPVQGPLAHRDIPRPMLLGASAPLKIRCQSGFRKALPSNHPPSASQPRRGVMCCEAVSFQMDSYSLCGLISHKDQHNPGFEENHLVQLIYHQNANGSWDLNEDLAKVLGVSLEEITAAHPAELVDSSGWATILAVIWLHGNGKDLKCEWELLERKAMAWMRVHADSTMPLVVKAAITFLKSSVDPAIFAF